MKNPGELSDYDPDAYDEWITGHLVDQTLQERERAEGSALHRESGAERASSEAESAAADTAGPPQGTVRTAAPDSRTSVEPQPGGGRERLRREGSDGGVSRAPSSGDRRQPFANEASTPRLQLPPPGWGSITSVEPLPDVTFNPTREGLILSAAITLHEVKANLALVEKMLQKVSKL